jgi:hypothetical protein
LAEDNGRRTARSWASRLAGPREHTVAAHVMRGCPRHLPHTTRESNPAGPALEAGLHPVPDVCRVERHPLSGVPAPILHTTCGVAGRFDDAGPAASVSSILRHYLWRVKHSVVCSPQPDPEALSRWAFHRSFPTPPHRVNTGRPVSAARAALAFLARPIAVSRPWEGYRLPGGQKDLGCRHLAATRRGLQPPKPVMGGTRPPY